VSPGTIHVVGAGVAGLAAALVAARQGRAVRLYEAAPQAGGRCRTIPDRELGPHDNGTHVLLGANRRALAFLAAIGAAADWIEPEPLGLPLVDFAAHAVRRVGLSPWSWRHPCLRPPGLDARTALRLLRLTLPGTDRGVLAGIGEGRFARAVLEPLAVAALNTPVAEASARRLAPVLRRLFLPGAGRLLVARRGLGPDLVEPALKALAGLGVPPPRYGDRLEQILAQDCRAERLVLGGAEVGLGPADQVVLALPPWAVAALFPDSPVPERFEPIVNLHVAAPYVGPPRFVGLLGATAQWLLLRSGLASVTVSAARSLVDLTGEQIAASLWPELRWAAARLGIPPFPVDLPPWRVVKERRATVSQAAGMRLRVNRRPLRNVVLAGDWFSSLPATLEAAVRSGEAAVGRRLFPPQRVRPAGTAAFSEVR
jgi:hypothetical protein